HLFNQVKEYVRAAGCTIQHFMLALVSCYFARVSGKTDIVIGVHITNRRSAIRKKAVGMFSSILPLRISVNPERRFDDLLKTISSELRRCSRYGRLPIPEINRCANLSSSGRGSLYDISVSFNNPRFDCSFEDWQPKAYRLHSGLGPTTLAITVNVNTDNHGGDEVAVIFEFDPSCLSSNEAKDIQARIAVLQDSVLAGADVPIKQLSLLSPFVRRQILIDWNATEADYPKEKCVHELFEEQAEKSPEAIALVHEEQSLSYGELNARANRLAAYLRELGVRPQARVAVLLERALGLVVAELATLKCGAAYVPIDPSFPDERQVLMVVDCGAEVVITIGSARLPEAPAEALIVSRVNIDEIGWIEAADGNLKLPSDGGEPAYVMYTSGWTGKPKGVMVSHRAIGRLVLNCGYAEFEAGDRVAFAANPAFDASTMEVWGALLNGGRIVVIDREAFLDPTCFA